MWSEVRTQDTAIRYTYSVQVIRELRPPLLTDTVAVHVFSLYVLDTLPARAVSCTVRRGAFVFLGADRGWPVPVARGGVLTALASSDICFSVYAGEFTL